MRQITVVHRELLETIEVGMEVRWRPMQGGWVALGEDGVVTKSFPSKVVATARSAGLVDTRGNVVTLTRKGQETLGDDLV